ncbi:DUF2585 family protein [Paracoccus benzoatiresistens]|uniref:DUF2585 family protein n=1 Tax=Paracoccus benzoatiresistens TaxID=2997341 RepID=A0ABT4J288_9RHOB|nr:DUF2585 family protein [Paracoccus sp. EF6]MCZ0961229.1 DUF2585 family protein [Paracoccus sp. EF6]
MFILLALATKLAFLTVLQRPLGCDCAQIWALPGDVRLNSRTMLDPYSLLHVIFGAVLVKLVRWKRPDWPFWTLMAALIVSSTIWEVAENLPASIALFGYSAGDPLAYHGDSISNSIMDTLVAVLGALLALPLSGWLVGLGALGGEVLLSAWVGDGFLISLWRAFGG